MEDDRPQKAPSLSLSDSISLVSFLFAVIAFAVVPSAVFKLMLLLLAVAGLVIALKLSHWTHSWSTRRRIAAIVLLSIALLMAGLPQVAKQFESEHGVAFEVVSKKIGQATAYILTILWIQRLLWVSVGVFIACIYQRFILAVQKKKELYIRVDGAERGFLDFKLQAETAMSNFGPTLASLTEMMTRVGEVISSLARNSQEAHGRSTAFYLNTVRRSAGKLTACSRQIDDRSSQLERIGASLREGLLGWFEWMNRSVDSRALLATLKPPLLALGNSIGEGIKQTNEYLSKVESARGVSQDMNAALDVHILAISRVRDINLGILQTCLLGLEVIERSNS